ncbi:MAG TPA: redox-sensing transcriptional repressor Rex [Caldilineae bacterium]|nr:redox-sensing transcriptional repressor Rex [Caldilineae bacterium]
MAKGKVSDIIIGRLPIYLRELTYLAEEGREITSSQELGDRLGISSAQIRKDLSHFGEFGKQGTGYHIGFLSEKLREILKVDRVWDVVLVGAGYLGHALANYGGFIGKGFNIVAVFDNDPAKIGQPLGRLIVQDSKDLPKAIKEHGWKIAILAVPASAAQEVTDVLVESGIRAILNYAPVILNVPPGVRVQYIDPVIDLQHMTYYL